jgi:hypothetical protein
MNRVLATARLQLVHPAVIFGMPWAIAASSFAINWGIWSLADLRSQAGDGAFTGGVLALYVTVALVFVQAVTQLMPLAMGLSLSRRSYWLGTALVGVASALGYGVALAVLSAVEKATHGWGVGLDFWAPGPLQVDNFFLQILVSGAPMLAFVFAGIGIGVVSKRWGTNGVWTLSVVTLLVLGGVSVLVTWLHGWDEIGRWLTSQSLATLAIGLPVLLAAGIAALSFRGIHRVVP